jgi:hypothetical protein
VSNSVFGSVERMNRCSISNFGIYRANRLARAQANWRDAARLVALRWDGFVRSEADSRAFAFASYVAALDAEEAAAAALFRLLPQSAACAAA